jgi:hypothetical protein
MFQGKYNLKILKQMQQTHKKFNLYLFEEILKLNQLLCGLEFKFNLY